MGTTTFPTTIDTFAPTEEDRYQADKMQAAIVAIETRMGLGAKVGTDISITGNVVIGGGTAYEIGALAGNIVLTFQTTGATEGDRITLLRTGTTAHTVTCNNGGAGVGTMCIMPASVKAAAEFEYINANWRLLNLHVGDQTIYASTGDVKVVAPAAGSVITCADDVEFSGAFKPTFASSADATFTLPGSSTWLMGSTGTAMTTTGAADGFSISGGTTPRAFSLTGGALACTAPAAGAAVSLAGNLSTTGAFNTTFAQTASATFTLPGASCTLADAAAGLTAQKLTQTIGHADLTTVGAGVAEVENIGAALPANARILGVVLKLNTPFTGGGTVSMDVQIGTAADDDSLVAASDVLSAAVDGVASTMTLGLAPFKHYAAGGQMIATFTPDGAHSTSDTTAGELVIDILYTVVA